jgi:chromosome segregation ATPase
MVVLVGLFGLLCVGFGVSVTEKYRLQKERVHGLERQLGAGRKEVLKVPELMENLDKAEVAKKEVEDKLTACTAEKDGFVAKASELQKEVDTFGAIKAAVGVQISGLQNTILEQQNKLTELENAKAKLAEQFNAVEADSKGLSEKFELQITDIKRDREDVKNQLIYYTEAKKLADQELAEKQKAITELQKAKEALEAELAKIKQPDASVTPETSSTSGPRFPLTESGNKTAEEIDKTFALLCERVTAPEIALDEVSILLSRMEKALKNLK